MGTNTSTTNKFVHSAEYGNASRFTDVIATVTGDTVLASIIRLCKVPAGTAVDRVVVKNTALAASALAAKIGFSNVDGTATTDANADVAVSAAAAFGNAAATTTFEIFPPFVPSKDSWLTIVVTTAGVTPAAGTINAKVEGEALGVK